MQCKQECGIETQISDAAKQITPGIYAADRGDVLHSVTHSCELIDRLRLEHSFMSARRVSALTYAIEGAAIAQVMDDLQPLSGQDIVGICQFCDHDYRPLIWRGAGIFINAETGVWTLHHCELAMLLGKSVDDMDYALIAVGEIAAAVFRLAIWSHTGEDPGVVHTNLTEKKS